MTIPALNKFLFVLSLATIATTVIANPAFAEPTTYQGSKGTYTIDLGAGTYRGCLDNGGCISLGRKNLIKSINTEFSGTSWKNGEYTYSINDNQLKVAQNGRIIFQDSLSSRSSEVGQVTRSKPIKTNKARKNTQCQTLSDCNQAIEISPQDSDAYLNRANFFEAKSNGFENALADYNKAVEVDPKNSNLYLKRARFKGRYYVEGQLEDYNEAIAVDPQNADLYIMRAKEFYHKYSKFEDELADYNKALEIDPENSSVYVARSNIKLGMRDIQGALADCKLALKYASTQDDKNSAKKCIKEIDNR
jgi:tetratricopeptide (TPR) repeat protein